MNKKLFSLIALIFLGSLSLRASDDSGGGGSLDDSDGPYGQELKGGEGSSFSGNGAAARAAVGVGRPGRGMSGMRPMGDFDDDGAFSGAGVRSGRDGRVRRPVKGRRRVGVGRWPSADDSCVGGGKRKLDEADDDMLVDDEDVARRVASVAKLRRERRYGRVKWYNRRKNQGFMAASVVAAITLWQWNTIENWWNGQDQELEYDTVDA